MSDEKIFYIAIVAFAALTVSCGKENTRDDPDDGGKDAGIIGTWLMRADEYHYFDVTFKKDGTYEWTWDGASGRLQDTGTYKYENKVATMTATRFFEEDYESKQMKAADMPEDWSKVRTLTFIENKGAVAWVSWKNDFFMPSSDDFRGEDLGAIIVFKEGADLGIKKADLIGTWEIKDEAGAEVDPSTLEAGKWVTYDQDFQWQWYIYIDGGKLYTPSFGTFTKK